MTKTARQQDLLDEIVDERSERNREFPELVEAALRRRKTLHELAQRRERRRIAKARRGDQLGQTSVTPDVTDV
jgi:hypothetical protein